MKKRNHDYSNLFRLSHDKKVLRYKRGKAGRGTHLPYNRCIRSIGSFMGVYNNSYSKSWRKGTVGAIETLSEIVNIAYLAGWKKIVLVGVSFYLILQ